MRLRRRYVLLAGLLGLAAATLPAIASSETSPTVEAVNVGEYSHYWRPADVSVGSGASVTLSNNTTVRHGVKWISPPATPVCDSKVPVGPTEESAGKEWSGTCTFSQPGTYVFYCTVHGSEMTGRITVSPGGTTTTTAPTTTTTTGTTTPTPETPPSSQPVGGLSLPSRQHGTSVRGSLTVSQAGAGSRLEVDLLATKASLASTKRVTRVRVGRFVRGSVHAGRQSFSVKLDSRARRSLARRHRLALIVKIVLTPFYGEPTTLTRTVVERP